ncbi:lipoprotein-anchoring transpeptidase ErfK/SrfK [Neorhizobium galegae]|uniref:L,D-transpeptidase n=1 Tax=Neorhizobium galegae TaxID=399 RepID=UPI001AE3F680|nr:L,D-transpeptidase [Neorhizobium galegae]MBP2547885.1 lipoprotein-anchoring transpeptidase ErfK/SrfK [Neorhizobium galegae]
MKTMWLIGALGLASLSGPALAEDRYAERPPVIVSPDLTAPWITQLGGTPRRTPVPSGVRAAQVPPPPGLRVLYRQPPPSPRTQSTQIRPREPQVAPEPQAQGVRPVQTTVAGRPLPVIRGRIEPQFLPQIVSFDTSHAPGTIIIDSTSRFLYLVLQDGKAKRYGVGVGKPGFEWAGAHTVTRKAEWPSWHPPQEMISREAEKGHYLPASMEGGPENPLGARALYLGSTLYRIHGTNAPWTIGSAVSSGCIRMRNEDVTDLYGRVPVGTKVIVI